VLYDIYARKCKIGIHTRSSVCQFTADAANLLIYFMYGHFVDIPRPEPYAPQSFISWC